MNITKEELDMLEASLTLLAGSTTSLLLMLKWEQIMKKYRKITTKLNKVCKGGIKCK